MAAKKPSRKFTPYRPPAPPAGSYDPALDSQLAAARRGLSDLQGQVGTQQARDVTDYAAQQQAIARQSGYNAADLGQSLSRGQADLGTSRTRGTEDYNRNVQMLTRQYQQLGRSQLQGINQSGVIRGGALLQAAAKRTENQGIDRQPIDTNYNRFLADNTQAGQRLQEDYNTQSARGAEATQTQLGSLALDYSPPDANNPLGGRRYQDRNTQLTTAQREQAFFGQDIGNAKIFQASGAGWDPAQKPANEFGSGATAHRIVREGNQSVAYSPAGKVLWRRPYRG
jgi:hypothetical protein